MEVVELQPGQDGSLLDLCSGTDNDSCDEKLLGYLNDIQELVVRQHRQTRKIYRNTNDQQPNVYFVYDKVTGQKVYHIQEKCSYYQQECGGAQRGFDIQIFDKFNRPVIELKRTCAICYGGCVPFLGCFSFLDKVTVAARNYKKYPFETYPVGQVKQNWNPVFPSFDVLDSKGNVQCRITGPVITSACLGDIQFAIKDPRTQKVVGHITKQWAGPCHEVNSDTNLFSINFPAENIDEKVKALLLGSMIFIDFKYFENCCPPYIANFICDCMQFGYF